MILYLTMSSGTLVAFKKKGLAMNSREWAMYKENAFTALFLKAS